MMMTAVTQCETWKTSGTVIPAATPSTKTTRLNQLAQMFRLVVPRLTARHQNRGPIKHARNPSGLGAHLPYPYLNAGVCQVVHCQMAPSWGLADSHRGHEWTAAKPKSC